MSPPRLNLLLADGVLLLHAAVVLFVVGALLAVMLGYRRGWRWVRAPAFRVAHLAAVGCVAAQSWFGVDCPLTTLELALRARAGAPLAGGDTGFVARGVQWLLYWDAPPWVFVVVYTVFLSLVVWLWWRYPPQRLRGEHEVGRDERARRRTGDADAAREAGGAG